jgi:hypothetical protein
LSYIIRRLRGTGSVRKNKGGYDAFLSRRGAAGSQELLASFATEREAIAALDDHYKDKITADPAQDVHGGEQFTVWLSPWLLDRMPKEDRSRWIREAMREKIERQG